MWQRGRTPAPAKPRRRNVAPHVQAVVDGAQGMSTRQMVAHIMASSLPERELRDAFYALPRRPEVIDMYVLHNIAMRDDL